MTHLQTEDFRGIVMEGFIIEIYQTLQVLYF